MTVGYTFDQLTGTTLGNYRLEQFIGQSKMGPVFLARTDAAATAYQFRFLVGPTNLAASYRDDYLERFQNQASQIAALQHPYILPLLDFGIYHGVPYLVSPHIAMRSLHTRLAKSGPLDVLTVGRYLDQVTATLEYAHQHAVLHGSLSVDCIFIRLDGQVAVADFGVIGLLILNRQDTQADLLHVGSEVYSPEQLLGKPVGTYTDVYTLGAVLFHMLTGSPVFAGNTPDEIAQQHLYAPVPPLSQWRSDLPAGLYSIIARALAKDPAQRFRHPGALANAYHRNVIPGNRTRVPFVLPASPATQYQQPLDEVASLQDVQVSELERNFNGSSIVERDPDPQRSEFQTPISHTRSPIQASDSLVRRVTRRTALQQRFQRKHVRHTILIAALIILLVAASSAIGITLLSHNSSGAPGNAGQVIFFDGQNGPLGHTDTLSIVAPGLEAPPAGSQYAAWLIDNQSEEVTALGALRSQGQSFTLHYTGNSSNGQVGTNLLSAGDKLEITLEQGTVKLPTGKVVLTGTFPLKSFAHIQHLLVGFPDTPGKIGFLVGVLTQTRMLNIQADVLQALASSRDSPAIECAAQSMINLIEGTHGTHHQPLAATCAAQHVTLTGDGFGLLGNGYLASAAEHATFAITQPDATSMMRLHAGLLAISLSNIKGWVTTIEKDALHLLASPADLAKVQEIAKFADDAYHGVDVNGDGQIDPVTGEAGALTAYLQGQSMATLVLTPGA